MNELDKWEALDWLKIVVVCATVVYCSRYVVANLPRLPAPVEQAERGEMTINCNGTTTVKNIDFHDLPLDTVIKAMEAFKAAACGVPA